MGPLHLVFPAEADKANSGMYDELFATGEYEMHRMQFEILSQGKRVLEFHRQQMLRRVERQTAGRNLVEVGGGVGSFGVFCRERGWNYVDYDISAVAVGYAKRLGLQAHVIANPNQVELPPADVVAMWEVIEHIWNVYEYLDNVRKSLKNGGFLIFSTPNYLRRGYRLSNNWGKASAPPVHVNFFTEESIAVALKSVGFNDVKVIQPRFYRPSFTFASVWYSVQIALGWESTKTLFVVASLNDPRKTQTLG
jgi:2-polyprenyl-3-methyl-5-hydroxy-6-metoxy-1,4-benzoquinol methylase